MVFFQTGAAFVAAPFSPSEADCGEHPGTGFPVSSPGVELLTAADRARSIQTDPVFGQSRPQKLAAGRLQEVDLGSFVQIVPFWKLFPEKNGHFRPDLEAAGADTGAGRGH